MRNFDMIVIGLGPAGMAVSIMASEMGLKVCAIEQNKIGGECMNVGCIPSKAILRMGHIRYNATRAPAMALGKTPQPSVGDVFGKIAAFIDYINSAKTHKMFDKVELHLGEGPASFIDAHTVAVGDEQYRAKNIFICAGSHPSIPPVPGLESVEVLTNETVFSQADIPTSLTIIGGGAIGCEMAQAFARLGCQQVTIVHLDKHLLPFGDADVGELLEAAFAREGIRVLNGRNLTRAEQSEQGITLHTDQGETITSQRLLCAAGRHWNFEGMNLDRAGVKYGKRGIKVNSRLATSVPHIFAPGDGNGHALFSHAAMHQGMLALMNCMIPGPLGFNFRKFIVPWTVFTEPQISVVGESAASLVNKGKRFETVTVRYEDYGAAIAEDIAEGWVKAFIHPITGRIYGARIAGEGSGEMIGEWALAIQKKIRIWDIMFLQHSFPTMSFLTKRVAETWMMNRMPKLRKLCQRLYGSLNLKSS